MPRERAASLYCRSLRRERHFLYESTEQPLTSHRRPRPLLHGTLVLRYSAGLLGSNWSDTRLGYSA
nr:hypothetical protein Q903MT_gene4567 [Picea sitchensis]